jgi:hypothetical protein
MNTGLNYVDVIIYGVYDRSLPSSPAHAYWLMNFCYCIVKRKPNHSGRSL